MALKDTVELLSLEVGCDRGAAGAVRAAVGRLEHLGWLVGDAMLIASELITNVVTRAGIDPQHRITVQLTESADSVTVSAQDPDGSRAPVAAGPTAPTEAGLGLLIVDALARNWGSEHDGGYRLWAELAKPARH